MCLTLNQFMPNVFSHPYQLDESFSNFRVIGWYFTFLNFKRNFCNQIVEKLIRRRVLQYLRPSLSYHLSLRTY